MEKKALDLHVFSKIVVVVDELADLMITSEGDMNQRSKDYLRWLGSRNSFNSCYSKTIS